MAVFAVIDRRSNNVLGEYAERDAAESLYRRLVEADPSVRGEVEIRELADLDTPEDAAATIALG